MDRNIFDSKGRHVAIIRGLSILDTRGQKLYNLRGTKIYRPSGELVGHLPDAKATDKRLCQATDRLFPSQK
jgi:hypothetical protein